MTKLKSVFWDVDGTLADTEMYGHRIAFNNAFSEFNLDWEWDVQTYAQLLSIQGGFNRINYYAKLKKTDLHNSILEKIHERKQEYYKDAIYSGKVPLRIGVKRLIEEINTNGLSQYIVTTSSRKAVDALISKHFKNGLNSYFQGYITYEDVKQHKPHPEAYLKAINVSGINPERIIVIEDSIPGLLSATKASLNSILTLPSFNKIIYDEMSHAQSILDNLGDPNKFCTVLRGKSCKHGYITLEYLNNILKGE